MVAVCLVLLALNPLSSYMGFYGSITGDIGLFGTFCSHLGIDTSDKWFILLFYKMSNLVCLLTGIVFLVLSIWYMTEGKGLRAGFLCAFALYNKKGCAIITDCAEAADMPYQR